jgi:hypothetical protein
VWVDYLFAEPLFPAGDEEHVVKKDDVALCGLPTVPQLKETFVDDLTSRGDDD